MAVRCPSRNARSEGGDDRLPAFAGVVTAAGAAVILFNLPPAAFMPDIGARAGTRDRRDGRQGGPPNPVIAAPRLALLPR